MRYSPLPLRPMQESGSALLRALQNDSMIQLDLLVREAVQNSLDAAFKPVSGPVSVDFSIRRHTTEAILSLFQSGIDRGTLEQRFPHGGELLEIRDCGTEGLSGPIRLQDVENGLPRGNLLKLVYEVGRSRSDDSSGGSWGLGKTCYFRIGAGLVLYYSRIRTQDHFEERLVACLVENEAAEERLQRASKTGIAWWGDAAGDPLTDSKEIESLLMLLGIRQFSGQETGTAIVIPFLRKDLIPQVDDGGTEDGGNDVGQCPLPWWFTNYETYIGVALQRWFSARLDNPRFRGGPALIASVNGNSVRTTSMLPVFQVLQALYNRLEPAYAGTGDYLDRNGVESSAIRSDTITLYNAFRGGASAGKVIATSLSQRQLQMLPPENQPDPYACIFSPQEQASHDRPLVAFMRCPGMVIRWDNSSEARGWGGGALRRAEEGILIALFVPDTDRLMSETICTKLHNRTALLESYLRACERADHHQWNDQAGFTIIARIRSKVGKHIREFSSGAISPTATVASLRIARNLADRLLPVGFGQDGRNPPAPRSQMVRDNDGNGRRQTRRSTDPNFDVTSVRYAERGIRIGWTLYWGVGRNPRLITLGVDSEAGRISSDSWSEEGLGPFPLQIVAAFITADMSPPDKNILIRTATYIQLLPWHDEMDGAVVSGEMTIRFSGELGSNLRPVLQVDLVRSAEDAS